MIWLGGIAIGCGLLLVWCCCAIAKRADARTYSRDEHAEHLGIGGVSFLHEDGNAR